MALRAPMRQRPFIILNPSAGVPRRRFVAAVLARLSALGAVATVVEPDTREQAAAMARDACATHDMIVAGGGDGTIRQVSAAISGSGVPLGIIPLGTGNVLAREIELGNDPVRVADVLIEGNIKVVQGALANNEPFYLMAGIGFDARVVDGLNQTLKRFSGRAAYAPALLRAWRRPVDQLSVTIDGAEFKANWLLVSNARHYGGSFVVAPNASIFSTGLKVILIRAETRRELAWQLLQLATGRLTATGNLAVREFDASHVTVSNLSPEYSSVPVQIDGDSSGTLPLTIDANGPQLRLIVPH